MKLAIREKYFLGDTIDSIKRTINKFIHNTYDDTRKISVQVLTSLPTAQQDIRGQIVIVPSSGVDKVYICRLNGSSYEWKEISWV